MAREDKIHGGNMTTTRSLETASADFTVACAQLALAMERFTESILAARDRTAAAQYAAGLRELSDLCAKNASLIATTTATGEA